MSTDNSEKTILFSFFRSSCAWRVRIALNLKNIQYETHAVNLRSPDVESKMKEYSAINPMMQIPALIIDGHTLIDSVAIMHYLEETRPEAVPLLPRDPFHRAEAREIVAIICSGIQPMQNSAVVKKLDEAKRLPWAQGYIIRGFKAIEQLLPVSAGKYCVGDNISMADCCLVPQVYNALNRYAVDMTAFPNIMRIYKELETQRAFKMAHPNQQPDYKAEFLNVI